MCCTTEVWALEAEYTPKYLASRFTFYDTPFTFTFFPHLLCVFNPTGELKKDFIALILLFHTFSFALLVFKLSRFFNKTCAFSERIISFFWKLLIVNGIFFFCWKSLISKNRLKKGSKLGLAVEKKVWKSLNKY